MTLTVEDGTGLSAADSYKSVADFKTYCDDHGLSYAGKTDTEIEVALRSGTTWLDGTFRTRLPGVKINGWDQSLEWPREHAVSGTTLYDYTGNIIPDDEVPPAWLAACCEASHRELVSAGSLSPDVTMTARRKRVKVEGAVEVEYADAYGVDAAVPILTKIDNILSGLIGPRSNTVTGLVARA